MAPGTLDERSTGIPSRVQACTNSATLIGINPNVDCICFRGVRSRNSTGLVHDEGGDVDSNTYEISCSTNDCPSSVPARMRLDMPFLCPSILLPRGLTIAGGLTLRGLGQLTLSRGLAAVRILLLNTLIGFPIAAFVASALATKICRLMREATKIICGASSREVKVARGKWQQRLQDVRHYPAHSAQWRPFIPSQNGEDTMGTRTRSLWKLEWCLAACNAALILLLF